MPTAKLLKHGGSQSVRLPKAFRFPGTEVTLEKRGDAVILRPQPAPELKTLSDVAHYMARVNPRRAVPDLEQPRRQRRELSF